MRSAESRSGVLKVQQSSELCCGGTPCHFTTLLTVTSPISKIFWGFNVLTNYMKKPKFQIFLLTSLGVALVWPFTLADCCERGDGTRVQLT